MGLDLMAFCPRLYVVYSVRQVNVILYLFKETPKLVSEENIYSMSFEVICWKQGGASLIWRCRDEL